MSLAVIIINNDIIFAFQAVSRKMQITFEYYDTYYMQYQILKLNKM